MASRAAAKRGREGNERGGISADNKNKSPEKRERRNGSGNDEPYENCRNAEESCREACDESGNDDDGAHDSSDDSGKEVDDETGQESRRKQTPAVWLSNSMPRRKKRSSEFGNGEIVEKSGNAEHGISSHALEPIAVMPDEVRRESIHVQGFEFIVLLPKNELNRARYMHPSTPDTYHVATKAFIRKDDDICILVDAGSGTGDLPGGRIGVGEFDVPLDEVLRREIEEELGRDFRYRSHGPVALFRHRREASPGQPVLNVYMIGFELEYTGGEIQLSDEHASYEWVSLDRALELLPGGQKEGLKKYFAYLEDPERKIQY